VAELYEVDDLDDLEMNTGACTDGSVPIGSSSCRADNHTVTSITWDDANGLRETYHAMIYTYARAGKINRARWLFEEMLSYDDELLRPPTKTYDVMLHCLASHGHVDDARRLFESLLWSSSAASVEYGQGAQQKAIVDGFAKRRRSYLPAHVDGRLYSSMVSILVKHGDVDQARKVVEELTARGYPASPRVMASIILGMGKSYSQISGTETRMNHEQHEHSMDKMFETMCADMVALFTRRGSKEGDKDRRQRWRRLFEQQQQPQQHVHYLQHDKQAIETYNAVLSTLAADSSTLQAALKLKARMENEGVPASVSAYVDLICELCRLCVVTGGRIKKAGNHKGSIQNVGVSTLQSLPEDPLAVAELLFDEVARSGMLKFSGF